MKVKVIREGVTFESGILDIGTEIDVADKAGKRLIADGYAEAVAEPEDVDDTQTPEDVDDTQTPEDVDDKKAPKKRGQKAAEK